VVGDIHEGLWVGGGRRADASDVTAARQWALVSLAEPTVSGCDDYETSVSFVELMNQVIRFFDRPARPI
jgi:hypothetical protein